MKEQTTITLPLETKKAVRIIAAQLNISMGKAALELIKAGLKEYKQKHGPNAEILQAAVNG